jgi:hypothetical protein
MLIRSTGIVCRVDSGIVIRADSGRTLNPHDDAAMQAITMSTKARPQQLIFATVWRVQVL